MLYVIGVEYQGQFAVVLGKDDSLTGSENIEEVKQFLPDIEKDIMKYGNSAAIHHISFKYQIFKFEDLNHIYSELTDKIIKRISNCSGSVKVLELKNHPIIISGK